MMKRALCATLALALFAGVAAAQSYKDSNGTSLPGFVPIQPGIGPVFTPANPGWVQGTFSSTVGTFTQAAVGTPINATTSGGSTTLPVASGSIVLINKSTSYPATCTFGATDGGAAYFVPASQSQELGIPAGATQITCTGVGGTATINVVGGAGIFAGAGGGGGGSGGGGTVTQGTAAAPSGAWPTSPTVGGALVTNSNPLPTMFGSGVTLPAFASPPTVIQGAAAAIGSGWPVVETVGGAAVSSGNPLPITDTTIGSASPGTAAASSRLDGGVYNSTAPTLSNAQQAAMQLDASGNLKVNVVVGGGGGSGGGTAAIANTPTLASTTAYTSGQIVGGAQTFASSFGSSDSGTLQSIHVVDSKSALTAALSVCVFTTALSGTYTDHASPASTFNATDAGNLVGCYALGNPTSGLGTMTVWNLDGIGKAIHGAGTNLYAVAVAPNGTTALSATTELTFTLTTYKDN